MSARVWLWLTVVLTGGAFAVAVALAPPGSAAPGRGLAWVLFAGSSVHVASTGWLYTLGDVRSYAASRSLRFWWAPAALALSGALAAAFLAADESDMVRMTHLIAATQREYQKMGKLVADGEFGDAS